MNKEPKPKEITFLIATDVHLGHNQNHSEMGQDSYEGFEEVLSLAHSTQVDFLLLGGDLFDEVNPSQKCLFKCLNLLKENIFGSRFMDLKVKGINPNYSNQNLNISLPIFTIHGNHDYPSNDFGKISVCDLLHASNYVNYFGKYLQPTSSKKIVVKPIIFFKDGFKSKLALYGLGYLKDLRLNEMLRKKQLIFEPMGSRSQFTNIFIFHQNRFKGKKGGVGAAYENCIHPQLLPEWFDLIIWCHEHESIVKIQIESDRKIYQPGSTVITSFIEAESYKKQAIRIKILERQKQQEQKFKLQPYFLENSFRPLFYKYYSLEQVAKDNTIFEKYFDQEIENILSENNLNKKPIIRMKIDYTGFEIIRLIKLEEKYKKFVANPNKIFLFTQKKQRTQKNKEQIDDLTVLNMIKNKTYYRDAARERQLSSEILELFHAEMEKTPLQFFTFESFQDSLSDFASIEGKKSINDIKGVYEQRLKEICIEGNKDIAKFTINEDEMYKKMRNTLLQKIQNNLNNELDQIDSYQYEMKIKQYRKNHEEKQKQYERKKGSTKKKKQPLIQQLQLQSEEEDCCQRAAKEDYHQQITIQNFKNAEEMIENKKKKKKGGNSV